MERNALLAKILNDRRLVDHSTRKCINLQTLATSLHRSNMMSNSDSLWMELLFSVTSNLLILKFSRASRRRTCSHLAQLARNSLLSSTFWRCTTSKNRLSLELTFLQAWCRYINLWKSTKNNCQASNTLSMIYSRIRSFHLIEIHRSHHKVQTGSWLPCFA